MKPVAHLVFAAFFLAAVQIFGQPAPSFSQFVVFGDSFSDDGNVRERTEAASGGTISYPSRVYDYADGRFTNSADTTPGSAIFAGLWHSLGGGTDFAFGGATTEDGTSQRTVIPFPGGDLTITIDNMGKQVDDYLATHVIDPNGLYVLWGGINDLLLNNSAASVSATANRTAGLVTRLALAGAKHILVPNVPPLGMFPNYAGDEAQMPDA